MKQIKNFIKISLLTSCFFHAALLAETTLPETNNLVKAGNKYVTLLGQQVDVGDIAPDFKVVDGAFTPTMLSQFKDKVILISVVPSLDTGVCSVQTKRFNDEVSSLADNVVILTISNDLPFAQKRFCKNENIDKIKVLSDSVWRDFGQKYGLLIKDMGLLTRAIFIIDEQGKVAYKELVETISNHPNYEDALSTLKALSPTIPANEENNLDVDANNSDAENNLGESNGETESGNKENTTPEA